MILAARLALFLAFLPALAAAARAAPQGTVERTIVPAATPTWNAVGRVNRATGGFCTGVLIGPSQVMTTATCAWDYEHHRFLPPDTLHFVAGYRHDSWVAHARAQAIRTDPRLVMDAKGEPQSLLLDWAVLRLEHPATAGGRVQPMPIAGPSDRARLAAGMALARAGYGPDRPYLPELVDPCHVVALAERDQLLLHDCDASPGDLGSPILVRRPGGGWVVLAIQVAVVSYQDRPVAAAVLLKRELPADAFR
jgi:protease YdgD